MRPECTGPDTATYQETGSHRAAFAHSFGNPPLQVEIDGKTVSLYAWMAERLASVLEVPVDELPSPASLNDVACRYLTRNDSNRNSIYTRLSKA